MDIGTIATLVGFAGLIFQAGIQWGISMQHRKNYEEWKAEVNAKIDQWEKDALEFYKNK